MGSNFNHAIVMSVGQKIHISLKDKGTNKMKLNKYYLEFYIKNI